MEEVQYLAFWREQFIGYIELGAMDMYYCNGILQADNSEIVDDFLKISGELTPPEVMADFSRGTLLTLKVESETQPLLAIVMGQKNSELFLRMVFSDELRSWVQQNIQ